MRNKNFFYSGKNISLYTGDFSLLRNKFKYCPVTCKSCTGSFMPRTGKILRYNKTSGHVTETAWPVRKISGYAAKENI